MTNPYISVVIPAHNEEAVLHTLYARLTKTLDATGKSFEIIFTNDGSQDRTEEILNAFHQERPTQVRVIHFNSNFGQHMAIMAGFENVRGEFIITMDADCQNPPEEIPTLIEAYEKGHDVVGGYRVDRQDLAWRKLVSRLHNWVRSKVLHKKLNMRDEGCMLRGYKRNIVDLMVQSDEASTFIPALALLYASNPIDVPVKHEAREAGDSSYGFYSLIRYNFDLVTNFSLVPLQLFTMVGVVVSMLSTGFMGYLLVRRLVIGPEADGLFTLFAVMFFFIGILLMGLGIQGEYIGRIYQEVRRRPRYVIREIKQQRQMTPQKTEDAAVV